MFPVRGCSWGTEDSPVLHRTPFDADRLAGRLAQPEHHPAIGVQPNAEQPAGVNVAAEKLDSERLAPASLQQVQFGVIHARGRVRLLSGRDAPATSRPTYDQVFARSVAANTFFFSISFQSRESAQYSISGEAT